MSFYDLLFEVSNEDRTRILLELKSEPISYSGLSRKLSITTQEVSRHLSRLNERGLTYRRPDGLPDLTPMGELVLRQLKSLEFTSYYSDYFREHTLTSIPDQFVSRLGELRVSTLVDNVMLAVHNVEKVLREADSYLLNINMPYIASAFPFIREAYDRGVKGRFLHGKDLMLPSEMKDDRERVLDTQLIDSFRRKGIHNEKLLKTDVVMYMSEKEVAILSFPLRDGIYDFRGFSSIDKRFLDWCRDIFEYCWARGISPNIG
jgi:predicted transcriptional regulator